MDKTEIPKCAPPPYTDDTKTQLPIIHVQPQCPVPETNESHGDVSTETNTTSHSIQGPIITSNSLRRPLSTRRFPQIFNLYYRHRLGIGRDYFLARTQQSEPLNNITFHSLRLPSVALHPGLDRSRAIATFNHSTFLRPSQVCATWLTGGHTDVKTRHLPRTWSFTARVGRPPTMTDTITTTTTTNSSSSSSSPNTVESFEWRHTGGHAAYYHLGARQGWKLLRLDRTAQARDGAERSRDGAEVVAAFSFIRDEAVEYDALRVREAFRLLSFVFVGVGAAGELGEEWEVLAVVTALGIWHRKR